MPTTFSSTDTITLTSTLIDYDPDTGEEIPVEADDVDGFIYKWDGSAYVETGTFTPSDSLEPGTVTYDWTPGSDGKFKIIFRTVIQVHTIDDTKIIYVGTFTPVESLDVEKIYYFLSDFEPMYLDPEEVLRYYPTGDVTEIAEAIHRYSLRAEVLVGEDPLTEVTPLVHDYILASVLCELSRLSGDTVLNGFSSGSSDSFRLGDLQVTKETTAGTSNSAYYSAKYGNATSWCEMAAWLRDELSFRSTGIKSYVKASKQPQLVRARHFRRFE